MTRPREYENAAERQTAYRARKADKAQHQAKAHQATIDLMNAMRAAGVPIRARSTREDEYDEEIITQAVDFFQRLQPGSWTLRRKS